MTNPKIKTIDVHELKNKRDMQPDLKLIDVREIDEWQELRIPGAIHMPKDEITHLIQNKIADKTEPVYLYCRGGVRSLFAAQCLLDQGYEEVYSVNGGIMEWAMSGYPIEQ